MLKVGQEVILANWRWAMVEEVMTEDGTCFAVDQDGECFEIDIDGSSCQVIYPFEG
jgi:hypothetical protein